MENRREAVSVDPAGVTAAIRFCLHACMPLNSAQREEYVTFSACVLLVADYALKGVFVWGCERVHPLQKETVYYVGAFQKLYTWWGILSDDDTELWSLLTVWCCSRPKALWAKTTMILCVYPERELQHHGATASRRTPSHLSDKRHRQQQCSNWGTKKKREKISLYVLYISLSHISLLIPKK